MAIEKHWASKQAAKQDEVRDWVDAGLEWAMSRRKEVAIAAGAVAAAALLAAFFFYARSARENEAWEKLGMAEAYAYYGRPQEAAAALGEVGAQNGSPAAAGLAALIDGDLKRARGEHEQAVAAYAKSAEVAPEALKPFALAEKAAALEAAGKPAECATAAAAFAESHADHFLGPHIQEILARCQLAGGQPEAAKATFQKITLQYPDTPWALRANARLQTPPK